MSIRTALGLAVLIALLTTTSMIFLTVVDQSSGWSILVPVGETPFEKIDHRSFSLVAGDIKISIRAMVLLPRGSIEICAERYPIKVPNRRVDFDTDIYFIGSPHSQGKPQKLIAKDYGSSTSFRPECARNFVVDFGEDGNGSHKLAIAPVDCTRYRLKVTVGNDSIEEDFYSIRTDIFRLFLGLNKCNVPFRSADKSRTNYIP